MRPRKTDRHLPACMYRRGPSYYFVRHGKWENLGKDYVQALLEYARLTNPRASTGMAALIDKVLDYIDPAKARNTMLQYRAAGEQLKSMLAEFEPNQVLPRHVAGIKVHMQHMPNSEELANLEGSVKELSARTQGLIASLQAVQAATSRIENFLLTNSAKR